MYFNIIPIFLLIYKVKIIKKIEEFTEYGEALNLFKNLTLLKKVKQDDNIFLDFSATTKGLVKKNYKFKIYYKFERK